MDGRRNYTIRVIIYKKYVKLVISVDIHTMDGRRNYTIRVISDKKYIDLVLSTGIDTI